MRKVLGWILLLAGLYGTFCGVGGLFILLKIPPGSEFYLVRGSSALGTAVLIVISGTAVWFGWRLKRRQVVK